MDWQVFGFKDDPLKTTPINRATLNLFTGHDAEVQQCLQTLKAGNARLVIEGARGVGTTSFANYLRFHLDEQKISFTPTKEIKVEQGWRIETLMATVLNNLIREIELRPALKRLCQQAAFQSAKALSSRMAETYRSFGIDAFGFGGSYGKQAGVVTQPVIVPSQVLADHLEDIIGLLISAGYKKGVTLQLNNLDVGEIHQDSELKYLLNALRDYTQIEGSNWLFVGDVGIRQYIASQVDRLDDIITFEVAVDPLPLAMLPKMLEKRVSYYRENTGVVLPIDADVFEYIYGVAKGRLRYVFGLVTRLLRHLYVGDFNDRLTLAIAKPMLVKLGKARVERTNITDAEAIALAALVKAGQASPNKMATILDKSTQYAGRILLSLEEKRLAISRRMGREKNYIPSIDAIIGFSDTLTAQTNTG